VIWAWDGFADRLNGVPADRAWKDKLDRTTLIERFS